MGLQDRPRPTGRSDGIDLLRIGLAAWVILTHLSEWGPLTSTGMPDALVKLDAPAETLFQGHGETHPAVVAFIVLSGYCIHRGGARWSGWSVRGYAIKRAFRIIPVYVVASLLGAALFLVAWHTNAPATQVSSGTAGITLSGMLVKLSTLTAVVPIAHMSANGLNGYEGNGPLYTVAAEMWLYAVYAGAAWLLLSRRLSEHKLWLAMGVATVLGLGLVAERPDLRAWWFNASLIGFLPLWWIGARAVGRPSSRRITLAALIVWVLASLYLRRSGDLLVVEGRLLGFGVLCATGIRWVDGRALQLRHGARRWSRCGYSLYAFHAPVLILLVALGVGWLIALLGALGAGQVMFWALENPTTQTGRRLALELDSQEQKRPSEQAPLLQAPAEGYGAPLMEVGPGRQVTT